MVTLSFSIITVIAVSAFYLATFDEKESLGVLKLGLPAASAVRVIPPPRIPRPVPKRPTGQSGTKRPRRVKRSSWGSLGGGGRRRSRTE
uniref:Uncharacterized protein n=1 Tax=Rhipicephalus appendiculatus TaxID=34631 RepID=A0A131YG43_RHIAP